MTQIDSTTLTPGTLAAMNEEHRNGLGLRNGVPKNGKVRIIDGPHIDGMVHVRWIDYGYIVAVPANLLRILTPEPVMESRPTPATDGLLATVQADAFEYTQTYECAAWYSIIECPAQEIKVHYSRFAQTASGYARGLKVRGHFPSLFGGVRVGGGGDEVYDPPEQTTAPYHVGLPALLDLQAQGKAEVTPLGEEWAHYKIWYGRALEAYRLAHEQWRLDNGVRW